MIDLNLINVQQSNMNISDEEMAKMLGFSDRSTWYKYRTGAYAIKAEMLPKLSKKLHINYEDFFVKSVLK